MVEPRKRPLPEMMRVLLYALFTFLMEMAWLLLARSVLDDLVERVLWHAQAELICAVAGSLWLTAQMLVHRRFVFQSGAPVLRCALWMLCSLAVWCPVCIGVHALLTVPGVDGALTALTWVACYLFQRFLLFRNTIDTL